MSKKIGNNVTNVNFDNIITSIYNDAKNHQKTTKKGYQKKQVERDEEGYEIKNIEMCNGYYSYSNLSRIKTLISQAVKKVKDGVVSQLASGNIYHYIIDIDTLNRSETLSCALYNAGYKYQYVAHIDNEKMIVSCINDIVINITKDKITILDTKKALEYLKKNNEKKKTTATEMLQNLK